MRRIVKTKNNGKNTKKWKNDQKLKIPKNGKNVILGLGFKSANDEMMAQGLEMKITKILFP